MPYEKVRPECIKSMVRRIDVPLSEKEAVITTLRLTAALSETTKM